MNDNDLINIINPTPAGRYTRELAMRVIDGLGLAEMLAASQVELILSTALRQASRDLAAGRFVNLEGFGEFVAVDNRGPLIRYQADRRLLEGCCIQNLKQAGGN